MIWVAKNLYFFNCLLDGAHTNFSGNGYLSYLSKIFLYFTFTLFTFDHVE